MAWNEAWIWLGGSLIVAVLSANVGWFFRLPRAGPIGSAVSRIVAWPAATDLFQFLRLLYYVGTPFAAMLFGHDAVTTKLIGLQPLELPSTGEARAGEIIALNWLDWARDAGWASVLGAGAFVLLLAGWWAYRRALAAGGFDGVALARFSGWAHLREAAYHEAHWAFYRNAPLIALRSHAEGAYWGIWAGLGVVALEAALNPEWRQGLSLPEQAPWRLVRVALASVSAVFYWKTQNLWLAIVLHFLASWALSAIARAPTPLAR